MVYRSGLSQPRKSGSNQTIHTYKPLWLSWMVILEALVGCHDILTLGKSPIKWRQCPDMTFAFDWDVKHEVKQKLPLPCLPSVSVDAYIW